MYNTPIFDALMKYKKTGYSPFFMPGHKMGEGIPSAFSLDLTELEETDNLHIPTSVINEALDKLKNAYGSKESFFLVNGSTSGIQAMFLSALNPCDKVIVARDCHVSCISAMVLSGAEPIFIEPEFIPELGVYGGILPSTVEKAIKENPDAKAVYITSPNYYGFCSDVRKISQITAQNNMLLLVDEAHGAHFPFHPQMPPSAIKSGADLCVQSAHKTLPALTQSAYLHSSGEIEHIKIQSALDTLLTSSPSYILLAYLDIARAIMEQDGYDILENIISNLNALPTDHLATARDFNGRYGISSADPSRLAIFGDFQDFPFASYGITPEMSNNVCTVFLPSAGTNAKDFERLKAMLCDCPKPVGNFTPPPKVRASLSLRDAFFANKEEVPLKESIGRICGSVIAPYPPGIPLIVPGEMITEELIFYIEKTNAPLYGANKNSITALR